MIRLSRKDDVRFPANPDQMLYQRARVKTCASVISEVIQQRISKCVPKGFGESIDQGPTPVILY